MQHSRLRGLDNHAPSNELVENDSGTIIPAAKVVRLNGMGTAYPAVLPADPTIDISFGIASTALGTVAGQNFGLVTTMGFMFNMNTSPWVVGTILFSDTNGSLSSTSLGEPVARVIQQDATFGILYVFAIAQILDEAAQNAWLTTGNNTASGEFLGTNTAQDLRFRTAGTQKAVLDQNGRFGIGTPTMQRLFEVKSHSQTTATGLQLDSWYVDTMATGWSTAIVVPITDPSTVRIEFTANVRANDGSARASFKRSGLFFRESSSVQVQGISWSSDYTQTSDPGIAVRYILNTTDVTFQVQPLAGTLYHWSGEMKTQQVF